MALASEGSARVVVAGSLFLVGAVRGWLDGKAVPRDPA
jgi:folylpolyglutamate synthase/dihydropteroate synthase